MTSSSLSSDLRDTPPALDWAQIDTVLLDMDGTLLDLHFDNKVWNEKVPSAFADAHSVTVEQAKQQLFEHMRQIYGTIDFYSFEYWQAFTGLDLTELHRAEDHLVTYRPGALGFLKKLKDCNKTVIIATNAHPHSVAVKDTRIAISAEVDAVVSSAELGAPKEDFAYWQGLHEVYPFDAERTLMVDDNEPVLDSARDYGIGHLLTIKTPDSARPERLDLRYPAFDHFAEISAGL